MSIGIENPIKTPCPQKKNATLNGPFSSLSAPARRALDNNGIKTLDALSKFSEKQVLQFHGIGKTAIPLLKAALAEKGLAFKE